MLLSLYLGFIYFLYLNLYYLVDVASMGWGSLMQIKHIFVWFTSEIMVKLAPYSIFRPTGNFLLAVLLWIFLFFEFNISCAVLSVPCDHLLGKGLPFGSLYVIFSFVIVTFLCGFMGHLWHLIASIPDFCFIPYLV